MMNTNVGTHVGMLIGVLDVGSYTAHLLVVNTRDAALSAVHRSKIPLRLIERIGPDGHLDQGCTDKVAQAVAASLSEAKRLGVREMFAYATAVIRDAPNRDEVIAQVQARTGVRLAVLPGETEATLTFLAARRWAGRESGSMALLNLGGGCLEVAFGHGDLPDFTACLPLGAGRLTREHIAHCGPLSSQQVTALRRHVSEGLRETAEYVKAQAPQTVLATSRTFQQLARLCGAAPQREGPHVPRRLNPGDLKKAQQRLVSLPVAQRAKLPGISKARARQAAVGAIVAHTTMKLAGINEVRICPWALREGVLLQHPAIAATARAVPSIGLLALQPWAPTSPALGPACPSMRRRRSAPSPGDIAA
ncbi:Ppx/GppA phosphatase family protein [Streptomyces zagrosensis]|uniref:Exopolyphosphatase/guanosine-5'-triphosphate, 3'-diphosphate pyrophosphatase n=1 Tax=Streptomyces zagrosensis TaxID=1042984 RepID=A0A7W9UY28_9ACTN|nr:Ppx/GppA family phosphatase [Streptomyces zagrosensis]MBB5935490.1 exopolyphosphatase/guanosine-5'-triphosphate,3'-diphosphate pyrophosphatase [Streptomyces zagrosensis]